MNDKKRSWRKLNHFDATTFFSVPDGETRGYFWVNKEGQSIDCNIYSPKYGKQYQASFFQSVHYTDPLTGKKTNCLHSHPMLCEHENSIYFNKDGIQVFKKETMFSKNKMAETDHDFAFIYTREKTTSDIKDEFYFIKILLEYVSEKEKDYNKRIDYQERDAKTLEAFQGLKIWLTLKRSSKEAQIRLSEALQCKDLSELTEKYGNGKDLLDNYYQGLEFAPDKERFLQNQIDIFQSTLKKYKSSYRYSNNESIELGHYKRLGFDWVNNGHNASRQDFETFAFRNTLHVSLPPNHRDQVSFMLLNEIARGAAIAFHVAFVKEQLKLFKEGRIPKNTDAYNISYSTDNSIEFRKHKLHFPFDCQPLANLLSGLREKLIEKDVCATDLQNFPKQIFEATELKHCPDLAGWILNILETWITDIEVEIHQNRKNRLFDGFLALCHEKALAAKPLNRDINMTEGRQSAGPIKAPIIALFCSIASESELMVRNDNESVKDYCIKVCKRYDLPYTDRVRQAFSTSDNKRNIQKVKEQILPNIDTTCREKVITHLAVKTQTK